jgi:hypothetical protein
MATESHITLSFYGRNNIVQQLLVVQEKVGEEHVNYATKGEQF